MCNKNEQKNTYRSFPKNSNLLRNYLSENRQGSFDFNSPLAHKEAKGQLLWFSLSAMGLDSMWTVTEFVPI